MWDAESVGIAIADISAPADAEKNGAKKESPEAPQLGDEQCAMDFGLAEGIAFSTAPGVSALVDFNRFNGGREAAIASLREVLSNGLLEKSVHDLKRVIGLLAETRHHA